jgi:hypothetical protein
MSVRRYYLSLATLLIIAVTGDVLTGRDITATERLPLPAGSYRGLSRSSTARERGSLPYNVSRKLPQCQTRRSKSSKASSEEAISHQSACPPRHGSSSPSQMRIALLPVKKR